MIIFTDFSSCIRDTVVNVPDRSMKLTYFRRYIRSKGKMPRGLGLLGFTKDENLLSGLRLHRNDKKRDCTSVPIMEVSDATVFFLPPILGDRYYFMYNIRQGRENIVLRIFTGKKEGYGECDKLIPD